VGNQETPSLSGETPKVYFRWEVLDDVGLVDTVPWLTVDLVEVGK
jgi:hypothetical protein